MLTRLLILAAALPLAACITPQFTYVPIDFVSEPAGAKVVAITSQRGQEVVCESTPCLKVDFRDSFGLHSRYAFIATKAGYLDARLDIDERTILDARVPVDVVSFTLEQK